MEVVLHLVGVVAKVRMKLETTLRHIRVAEFRAEALEREADAILPSYQDRANQLRQCAKAVREGNDFPGTRQVSQKSRTYARVRRRGRAE
jgi:hypothetical protein